MDWPDCRAFLLWDTAVLRFQTVAYCDRRVTAIFVACRLPFIRGLTRTVARISHATEQIAEGEFNHHLPDDRGDELGQLSVAINRMADRLSGFVKRPETLPRGYRA
jgi:HAMP domain-containing protein